MDSPISAATDAAVRQGSTSNFGGYGYLTVSAGATARRSFIFFPRPFPVGATVVSAVLRLTTRSGFTISAHTLSVYHVAAAWLENTINWDNQPGVDGAAATLNIGTPGAGYVVEIDVTAIMQAVAAGGTWFGLRVSDNVDQASTFYSSEASDASVQPELEVIWTSAPSAPTDMRPSGGRVVSLASPTLTWKFNDMDGDEQSAFRVEVAHDAAFTSSFEDSGWVSTNEQQYTLAGALTDGSTYYWRVTTKDSSGVQSPVSDIQQFGRDIKGTVAISNPGATSPETTPPVIHALTGETQSAHQTLLYEKLAGEPDFTLIHDSGIIPGTGTSYTIPPDLITSTTATYRVVERVWDTKDREATPGDPRYAEDSQDFTYVPDGTPDPVTGLTLTTDDTPSFILDWSRSSAPDYFALTVDGKVIQSRIDPAAVFVVGTSYRLRVWELAPNVSHVVSIEAVVIDLGVAKHSSPNPSVSGTLTPLDAWFVMPSKNLYVRIATADAVDYSIGEDGETFFPIGRRDPVRIVSAIRGHEGTISGGIGVSPIGDGDANRKALMDMKSWHRRGEKVLLINGNQQFEVLLGEASVVPEPGSNNRWGRASVQFWQRAQFGILDR